MDAKTVQNKNTLDMTTGNTLGHLLRFTGPLLIGKCISTTI